MSRVTSKFIKIHLSPPRALGCTVQRFIGGDPGISWYPNTANSDHPHLIKGLYTCLIRLWWQLSYLLFRHDNEQLNTCKLCRPPIHSPLKRGSTFKISGYICLPRIHAEEDHGSMIRKRNVWRWGMVHVLLPYCCHDSHSQQRPGYPASCLIDWQVTHKLSQKVRKKTVRKCGPVQADVRTQPVDLLVRAEWKVWNVRPIFRLSHFNPNRNAFRTGIWSKLGV